MPSFRTPYKTDISGNAIEARINWTERGFDSPRPIALIYHAGGLVAGTCEIIPKTQINYLCSKGFIVVMPNYRLVPQVSGREALADCEEAFDWTPSTLPQTMKSDRSLDLATKQVVVMGHSSGGTMALHLASVQSDAIKAAAAFFVHSCSRPILPTNAPPFDKIEVSAPTEEDWESIKPEGLQISEAPFPSMEGQPSARNKWIIHIFKTGQWFNYIAPGEGDAAAIDPMIRVSSQWPATMIVHGSEDNVPGRSVELVRRAERELKEAGVKEVRVKVVEGAGHVFDHAPAVGTSDLGQKWLAVVEGLDWLVSRV